MEKGVAAFILGISLMITVPITIGLFAVKGSMDNISLGHVATGMDSISDNLEKINRVLGSVTEGDLKLIRNVFLMINSTLSSGINFTPNLDININTQDNGVTNPPVIEPPNLRRI
tara:strand:+ start:225 stop:569 length:345 start_codon:yes stop_codon:yes gene_type:complete